jgi:hypothetical protein
MIKGNLLRRLGALEEQMVPAGPPKIINVVYVNSDGTLAPGGYTIEIPSYGPAQDYRRGAAGPRTLPQRRLR